MALTPSQNPPAYAGATTAGIVGLVAALQAQALPVWAIVVIVVASMVLGAAGGWVAQRGTDPKAG